MHLAAISILENISRDFVFNLGDDFKRSVSATIRCSLKDGVKIIKSSDKRLQTIFENNLGQMNVAIPRNEAMMAGLTQLKQITATPEQQKQAAQQFGKQPVLFFDPAAFMLYREGMKDSVTVDLKIEGRNTVGKGGCLTTGSLRFPHLLKDIAVRFSELRKSDTAKVCIVGPGLHTPQKGTPTCPQFVELLGLFPKAEFLLLDNDDEALKKMQLQYKTLKFAAYDPLVYRMSTMDIKENKHLAPASYQPVLGEIGEQWGKIAKYPKNADQMLKGFGKLEQLLLNVSPEKIHLRSFEINSSEFKGEEKKIFDVVVATMSIILAMRENPEKPLDILCKHLSILKENGSFYSDSVLIHEILKLDSEMIQSLEEKLDSKLVIEEIPMSDYLKGETGSIATIPNPSREDSLDRMCDITTASITVITRKAK